MSAPVAIWLVAACALGAAAVAVALATWVVLLTDRE